jgi:ribosomal protein S18 acetylase RimI-like enzyme/predicted nucleic acid-binding protein
VLTAAKSLTVYYCSKTSIKLVTIHNKETVIGMDSTGNLPSKKKININRIDESFNYLDDIKKLWRTNSQTLGFFTDGAFHDHAVKQQILIATNNEHEFCGYLLYRITTSRNIASIVHLCVRSDFRSLGIAALLLEKLVSETQKLKGIGLYCRRDFKVAKLWPKLGFKARSEKSGRSISGSTLTYWWYDHNHPDLFTSLNNQDLSNKEKVVIDANVFYDIKNQSNDESLALTADFLEDTIVLCLTDEIFQEIERSGDPAKRESARAFASKFHNLQSNLIETESKFQLLKKHMPTKVSEQNISDYKHLAKAICANAKYYVTRDERVLKKGDEIYYEHGISVFRPSDLITQIDSLYRQEEYQPERLGRTIWNVSRVQSKQESLLIAAFQNHQQEEKQYELRSKIDNILCDPKNSECNVIWDTDNNPIGLIAYSNGKCDELNVSLLRVKSKHPLAVTIARYLIETIVKKASAEERQIVRVLDVHICEDLVSSLESESFIKSSKEWTKLIIVQNLTTQQLNQKLISIDTEYPEVSKLTSSINEFLLDPLHRLDIKKLWQVESAIWPGKLTDADIPCFIISIQPQWAQQLFDKGLADQDLFGAKIDLALNREGVYYRAKINSSGISAPARILWYVSESKASGKKYHGIGAIKAHSRLEEVIIDHPKPLFNQFRRLGIYDWKDVFLKANKDHGTKLMALRFSKTELLKKPLSRQKAQELLRSHGIKTQFLNPCPIPSDLFFNLISGI